MKIALIVSLLSALQIHHQTVLNVFTTKNNNLISEGSFTIIAAAFPIGKVFGTFFVEKICKKWSILAGIDLNGICLLFGGLISLIPFTIFLALGRFIIGIGVGCGFVLSSVIIYDFYPFEKRANAFFIGAILFGSAALYSNIVVAYFSLNNYFVTSLIVNLPSLVCGLIYFLDRPAFIDIFSYPLESTSRRKMDKKKSIDEETFSPMTITYFLIALNASIGVPIVMAFSTLIFENMGVSSFRASQYSILYPLTQLTILSAFRLPIDSSMPSRKSLILGGYGICLVIFFSFLLSIQGIEDDKISLNHNSGISAALFLVLAVLMAIPCNTSFCFITERFPDRESRVKALVKSRMLLWGLSALESATFLPILNATNLFIALIPYLVISVALFVFLLMLLGSMTEEEEDEYELTESDTIQLKNYSSCND
uniref:Major facilitator superfamily (MFS) profile domain-containing protein n=1 Tax=Panagrolaimus sp. PS1159 TaxID=55785 RepID=A0AC35F396_9BILA